jgi:Tol biopolymer transport system component
MKSLGVLLAVAASLAASLACNTLLTPSPVGTIVFTSRRDGDLEIYSMDASGQNQTRLTDNPGYDQGPAWSPDGKRTDQ